MKRGIIEDPPPPMTGVTWTNGRPIMGTNGTALSRMAWALASKWFPSENDFFFNPDFFQKCTSFDSSFFGPGWQVWSVPGTRPPPAPGSNGMQRGGGCLRSKVVLHPPGRVLRPLGSRLLYVLAVSCVSSPLPLQQPCSGGTLLFRGTWGSEAAQAHHTAGGGARRRAAPMSGGAGTGGAGGGATLRAAPMGGGGGARRRAGAGAGPGDERRQ